MAGAEARAVWQRTANRCFVQEDAKRAPKLACCQSSSSSWKPVDEGPTSEPNTSDQQAVGFTLCNRNPLYTSLPPDTRWWLQLQPSFGYQKGLTYEQLTALETEVENLIRQDDGDKNTESTPVVNFEPIANYVKKPDIEKHRPEALYCKSIEEFELGNTGELSKQIDIDTVRNPKFHNMNACGFDPEAPWNGGEKNMPWWRGTDKDNLATLISQKSLNYIQNCDLPPPQNVRVTLPARVHPSSSDQDAVIPSSSNLKAQKGLTNSSGGHAVGSLSRDITLGSRRISLEGHSRNHSDTSSSGELHQVFEGDPSKAELLEALRHSQTRAREAEKVAEQACAEKEDLLKLFLKQASQLFAYKQWFQLLQLETLYHRIKNEEQPMSNLFPVVLPSTAHKGRELRKNWPRCSKGKRSKWSMPKHDIGVYAVAFALGLSLVGAGLLLGWTVGWMLPF